MIEGRITAFLLLEGAGLIWIAIEKLHAVEINSNQWQTTDKPKFWKGNLENKVVRVCFDKLPHILGDLESYTYAQETRERFTYPLIPSEWEAFHKQKVKIYQQLSSDGHA